MCFALILNFSSWGMAHAIYTHRYNKWRALINTTKLYMCMQVQNYVKWKYVFLPFVPLILHYFLVEFGSIIGSEITRSCFITAVTSIESYDYDQNSSIFFIFINFTSFSTQGFKIFYFFFLNFSTVSVGNIEYCSFKLAENLYKRSAMISNAHEIL